MTLLKSLLCATLFSGISTSGLLGDRLIAHYPFDSPENLGRDISGNGLHLLPYDIEPQFVADEAGGAASFDGSTQGFITPRGYFPDGSFTIATWIKTERPTPSMIFRPLRNSSGFGLSMAWAAPEYSFATYNRRSQSNARPRANVRDGEWHHLSVVFESRGRGEGDGEHVGDVRFYLNGILMGIESGVVYLAEHENQQCIGRRANDAFQGRIRDYRLYRGVIEKMEIEKLAGVERTLGEEAERNPPLEWKTVDGVSIPIPPKERPRLYLRSAHIADLERRMSDPILSQVWQELIRMSEDVLPEDAPRDWRYYLEQRGDSVQAEIDALRYLMSGDREEGRAAIKTALQLMQDTVYPPELGDIARASGRLMVTGAIVYDWCYDLLTAGEKEAFVEEFVRLAKTLECGYPPVRQSSVVGHSSEWMILRDLISAAIAIYDEFPEMYELTAGRIFREHVPVRNWFYPGHTYHQGPNYDRVRMAPDLYATWIFDRMGAGNIFHPDQRHLVHSFFYRRRPDGQFLASGDHNPTSGAPQVVGAAAMLSAGYYQDEYSNYEFVKRPRLASHERIFEFLWRDTLLDARNYRELPLTRYFGFPFGWMIARTDWGDSGVIAEFKVNVYNFLNHQHQDAGAFQIYHKGPLAIDSGIYTGTSGNGMQYNSPHNKNYFKRTIAHNSLLIFDPDEVFESHNYGGAHRTPFADNDGGQRLPGDGWRGPRTLEEMLNKDYKTGEVLGHGFGPDGMAPDYSYLKGDITEAYSDKVEKVVRSFVFLNLKNDEVPAAFVVFDRVVSRNPEFQKYWLLHSIEEPEIEGRVTTITRTKNDDRGKLVNHTLLPEVENAVLTPIGGPGKEFWVFGTNYENEPTRSPDVANERGAWRVELTPRHPAKEDYFLNVMQVMDRDQTELLEVEKLTGTGVTAVRVADRVVVFGATAEVIDEKAALILEGRETTYKVLFTDLKEGYWQVRINGEVHLDDLPVGESDRLLYFEAPSGEITLIRKK